MKNRPLTSLCAFVGAAGLASSAMAQIDTEPLNNAQAGADNLNLLPMQAKVNIAGLGGGGGDMDFFSNFLLTGEYIVAMTTPLGALPGNFSGPDTILGGVSPGGALQPVNDDGGTDGVGIGPVAPTRGSVIRYQAFGSGTHSTAVTGFADFGFGGAHTETGGYAITAARFPLNPAVGGNFPDNPGNQTFLTPDPLGVVATGAVTAVCALSQPGDVDFYYVFLNAGDVLSAMTTPLETFPSVPDTLLGVFDPAGTLLFFDDDSGDDWDILGAAGPTRGSAVRYMATSPGLYFIATTGFGDFDFNGIDDTTLAPHTEVGRYGLTASVIPTPASGLLLGLGAFIVARRRRNA